MSEFATAVCVKFVRRLREALGWYADDQHDGGMTARAALEGSGDEVNYGTPTLPVTLDQLLRVDDEAGSGE